VTTTGPPATVVKVLVVDDDDAFRRSTTRALAARGYTCLEAASSSDARIILDTEHGVSAVLCDIKMPGRSGLELLRELTADFPDLAVVMTTGLDDPQVADVAFDIGAYGYLVKPFSMTELVIGLAGALRRAELETARRATIRSLEETIRRTRTVAAVLDGLERKASSENGHTDVIERLSRALSLRDEETGRHIERMSRYSAVVAESVGFAGVSVDDLRLASALHDVGKIGIPDGILLKPGALSAEEYTGMQRHAQIGYQLLARSETKLLRVAADIALSHHEWWDGGGYPRGLVGEQIPEEARIAAITDVFDALTCDRVYRPALAIEEAVSIMTGLRGRQFEPRLFDAFLGSMDEILSIRQHFPDHEDGEERIRLLLVDDHVIFLQSLVRLLATKTDLKVVGSASTAAQAVQHAIAYEPDVILMDFELPDGNGPEAAEQI
jgi:putative two-component system response regulator